MKTPPKIKSLSIFLFIIAASFTPLTPSHAANLFIDPASPLVQVGGEITLCVNNPIGDVKWYAFEGEIERTGNSVKYKAPDRVAIDAVTAKDSAGNIGTAAVVVQEKEKIDERFSKKNANLEVFTNRDNIHVLFLSDDAGTFWVGTNGGLEKRDADTGQVIRVFTIVDGLPSNDVNFILSDSNGGLWVGTGGGLAHYKADGTWQVFNKDHSGLQSNYVYSLLSDGQNGLWVGTNGGLAHYKADGTWQVFNKDNSGLPDNFVESLLSDGQNGLWVGTNGGLAHFKADSTWQVFNEDNSEIPSNWVYSLLLDGQNGLWVGTWGGGLAHLKSNDKWDLFNKDNFDGVHSLLSDGEGGVWIGTSGGGLIRFKSNGRWEEFDMNNSGLPSNNVNALLSDGRGGLWIGHPALLAHFKSDHTWEVFSIDNHQGLADNNIHALLSDGSGGIWIGTYLGVSHFKADGTWDVFNENNSRLPNNWIWSLLSDGTGGIWIGTGDGLAHLKADGTWDVFNMEIVLYSLLSDGSGGIWIGTREGLAHLKSDGTWDVFNKDNAGLPHDGVWPLLSDGDGGIWIGTYEFGGGGGLAHFKSDGTWDVFNKDNAGLPNNDVRSLLSDGDGGIWIGTGIGTDEKTFGGLAHLKSDGTWDVFNKNNSGLLNGFVWSLLSDGCGGLWIGTDNGLLHFKSDGTWEVLNTDNRVNSLLSDGNGGIWVGTESGGLAHLTFSTSQIQEEQYLKNNPAAIIIAGGGNTSDNALWDSTAKISNYAYKVLNKRGFLNNDIHYISPQPFADFNGDGIDDKIVDSPNPSHQIQVSDIQAAFDWAKAKGTLNQPLYIFFTDHGGNEQLQLAQGVYIKASELKTMLDDYQKITGNKVVVIIDACHSGTMVKALAGENRAVISSTGDGVAYFDRLNGQSFIWYVTKGLNKGMNFSEAFYYASSEYKKTLGKVSQYESISAGSDNLNLSQEPQFDDNGDGLYNISVDGNWLKTVSVNGTWSNADVTLTVEAVTQSGIILNSNTQTILKAKAALAKGRVNRVWAVIRPPKMDILFDSTTGTPILAFPKIDLSASKTADSSGEDSNTTDAVEQNIYQGSWNGFIYNGEYEITFYAEDNDKNIESSESIVLTVADGLVCPEKGSIKVSTDKQPDTTGKITYKSGDKLKISVTENLAYGYDLYAALLMPDGNFMALKNPLTNENISYLQKENFNKLYWGDRWIETSRNINMGKAVDVVDLTLSDDLLNQGDLSQGKLPSGQYCVYAALIPEGQDLVTAANKGLIVLDGVCFEVSE